ncbi:GPI-anchored wall transfer protein 1 [Yarrowia lipolytica]|jgi:phosphatidylinositol glycan class W|uniref:GPI-anchored wall transfer protein 1 n=2 Tax=Yarrowia lipolytica TaxID=4952 RepID=GWT1_YARLI|nr:YALI0C23793p [Yarrowia lipolytica CLIB122]Q6CAW6.1 RecName: Full=GPI-anchored wall transfer protein 1 [Yarrowia lipolytica CLIB122]AOW03324.1 hypothetical protein YALI1_C32810g [Yarrowia lipolytica]KAB8280169.1 GPI-anchored wall transfer protein 1 [Yarrowia lipolytica]KAE8170222.1 GPI-anchored wall transfer protein 1 [Yarrowia lipolytica]KAJ8053805.1 GPI-anchored wall transfer protein 1 [Yarrowia lipolytica]QNP96042.1 GPI-anchored wall transfer protein 1 [Yarrowia lipolytica]|eukprot:XP_502196.1 YALI0C23793p [Yarrowia lipolytica CLIB122]
MSSQKLLKEEHVSGLTGGSIGEIYVVTCVNLTAYVAWALLRKRYGDHSPWDVDFVIFDFLLNWLGLLLSVTIYSNQPLLLNALIIVPAGVWYIWGRRDRVKKRKELRPDFQQEKDKEVKRADKEMPFLSVYRGSMMVITCIAILAVDFNIFPRRFAKVETWGTSMMDLGVGSFVFSMGVVSKPRTDEPFGPQMKKSLKHAFPVLVLGFIRLISVKSLDYQEHVSEYGVHWNFFFTLGFLPPFVTLVGGLFKKTKIPLMGQSVIIALAYDVLLSVTSLKEYILTAPRVDIFSQNKEGIFSFIGYLAIFLAGQAVGTVILRTKLPEPTPANSKRTPHNLRYRQIIKYLTISSILFHVARLYYDGTIEINVSRRLVNMPYYLWVCAYNTFFLGCYAAIEVILVPIRASQPATPRVPLTLDAVNYNGLVIFLLANIGTGLINMSVNTLEASPAKTMVILVAYCAALSGISLVLYKKEIRLKL